MARGNDADAAYHRRWRQQHRDRLNALARARYAERKQRRSLRDAAYYRRRERLNELKRARRKANPALDQAAERRYRQKHPEAWRNRDRERHCEWRREWHQKNRERVNARLREKRRQNPEKTRVQFAAWYSTHGLQRYATYRERRRANPELAERVRALDRLWRREMHKKDPERFRSYSLEKRIRGLPDNIKEMRRVLYGFRRWLKANGYTFAHLTGRV